MRLSGEWLQCADGDIRPIVRGAMLGGDGIWRTLEFLVDTGADRTVVSATVLLASNLPTFMPSKCLGGIGGVVETVVVESQFRIVRDDGVYACFRGQFAACTHVEALDMSILERDILDMFALIIDRRADVVAILGGHHSYTIQHRAP